MIDKNIIRVYSPPWVSLLWQGARPYAGAVGGPYAAAKRWDLRLVQIRAGSRGRSLYCGLLNRPWERERVARTGSNIQRGAAGHRRTHSCKNKKSFKIAFTNSVFLKEVKWLMVTTVSQLFTLVVPVFNIWCEAVLDITQIKENQEHHKNNQL